MLIENFKISENYLVTGLITSHPLFNSASILFQSLRLTLICLFVDLNCLKLVTLKYGLAIYKLYNLKYRTI